MAKRKISHDGNLLLMLHFPVGTPAAYRIHARQALRAGSLLLLAGVVGFCGTLLFFRELEVNRRLTERVLDLETREIVAQSISLATPRTVSGTPPATTASPAPATAGRLARVTDLTLDCEGEGCDATLSLLRGTESPTEGQLLMVLETEIPRIGGIPTAAKTRHRYYFHPPQPSLDELTQNTLVELPRKNFRFARSLNVKAHFSFTKLLRPLAIHAYLFDQGGGLVHHERKSLDPDSSP